MTNASSPLAVPKGNPKFDWNSQVLSLPEPHILQTQEWGLVKARFGWQPFQLLWVHAGGQVQIIEDPRSLPEKTEILAAAQALQRTISIGGFAARLRIIYVPKGPIMDWGNASLRDRVLSDLHMVAMRRGAIFIKIDPDVKLGLGIPSTPQSLDDPLGSQVIASLQRYCWRFSEEQIQFRNTVCIHLDQDEDHILARMKPKTRYNIRLSERKGVSVRLSTEADLDLLNRMYAETAVRDGFVIRPANYYHCVWKTFMDNGMAVPLIAEVANEPVAALVLFTFGKMAWYLYGMSLDLHRETMPNYLLQWRAIQIARERGCQVYDLWGAPDDFTETDRMWGVFRFKEGLGGKVVRHLGAWDLPVRPVYYKLYTQILPRILDILRRRGKEDNRQRLQGA